MVAFRKRNYRKGRPAKKRAYRKKAVGKKSIARVCRSVITKMAEVKQVRYNWQWNFGSITTTGYVGKGIQPLTPLATFTDIAQGTGQANRIGNKITTKSLIFDGAMWQLPYNLTSNKIPRPQDVMMVIFSDKQDPNTFNPSTIPALFQSGNSAASPTGTMIDTILPFNYDRYTIYYKRMFKVGTSSFDGTGYSAAAQGHANNDYKYSCRFRVNCTKYVNKLMRFNDTNNTPNCKIVRVAFLPIYADGLAMDADQVTLSVAANWTYSFQDI